MLCFMLDINLLCVVCNYFLYYSVLIGISVFIPLFFFSDLGLDQFIVKRYDGKVRSESVGCKEVREST